MRAALMAIFLGGLLAAATLSAQPPGGGRGRGEFGGGKAASVEEMVDRLMKYDANKDGKLTKEELNDPRLDALFDRADKAKRGYVTKDDLTELFTKEAATLGRGGFGGGGGPGGFTPPQPGQIVPPFLQDRLDLSEQQKKDLAALQKEVDAKLEKLLTDEQKKILKEMQQRGPGGFPGGPPPRD